MNSRYKYRNGSARVRSPRDTSFSGPASKRRDLIRLDTNTIRRKALGTYHHTEKTLAVLKKQLKQYHDHDIPEFRAWIHKTFGQLMTRQREIARTIEDKNSLLFEIEEYANLHFISELEAYKKVLWRRAHPEEALDEDRQFEKEQAKRRKKRKNEGDKNEDPWFEDDDTDDPFAAFDDFDAIPDTEWKEFSEYFEMMTGRKPPQREIRNERKATHPDDRTAKEIYRTIVRRLHPDHHGQMNEARQNLWHEAQSAYRNRDINTLYRILSRCDESEAGIGNHSPVSLIQRLTRQLKKTTGSLRNEIRKMKSDHAWKFEEKRKDPGYVRQLRQELEEVVYVHEMELRNINSIFSQLEREAARADTSSRRRAHTGRQFRSNLEFDLPF